MIEWFYDQRNSVPAKDNSEEEAKEPYGVMLTDHALQMLSVCQNHTSSKR
jgi:hypothetical protein